MEERGLSTCKSQLVQHPRWAAPQSPSSAGGAGLLRERRSDRRARAVWDAQARASMWHFKGWKHRGLEREEREQSTLRVFQMPPGRTAPPESKSFKVPSHLVSSAALRDSAPPERPCPAEPLLETVEDGSS